MHRILLNLGPITLYSYGGMLALSFFLGTYLAVRRAKRKGIEPNKVIDLFLCILIAGIAGSRLLFVILNWGYYRHNLEQIWKIWEGGLVFYGGFISGFLAAIWFLKKNKMAVWKTADIIIPSLAIGIAIGRIGCFLNGCCYGIISYRFGVCFPAENNSPVFSQQVLGGLIPSNAQCSLPILPTQLYDAFSCLAIFLALLYLERYSRFDGFLFWIFVLFYSISRFIIEGLRFYEKNFILPWGITVSQLISLIIGFIALSVLLYRPVRFKIRKGPL